jgi:hypothetical protein
MNKQKGLWLLSILGIILIILLGILIFVPAKNNKPKDNKQGIEGITVSSPLANQEVSFPIEITGYVDGKNGWAGFEGQVGVVELINKAGVQVASAPLPAVTDWMKFPTEFKLIFDFSENIGYIPEGMLVFHNENPSGDPAKNKTFSLPIKIKADRDKMAVRSFFVKNETDNLTCNAVFPLSRLVQKTQAVAKAALEELLAGPTDAEKLQGYSTSIPAGSKLNSISIVNGEARADFNEATESGGGSCSMAARVAQIKETLLQFPTVTSVKLSINGRTGDIFQP